jgi:hypothetical protein
MRINPPMTLAERLSSLTWGGADYPSYEGRLDRAAQGQAKTAANTAANVAGSEESQANAAQGALTPFYRSEMSAQHGFDPGQTQELLNYAGAGVGGSGAAATGEAASEAARTRNTSGFSSALDQNARQRQQEMATVNAGVGAQDVMGAKALNQEGAQGEAGLYGTDTSAMLSAMGQVPADINAETQAGNSGWFENLTNGIGAGANLIKALKTGQGGSGGGGGGN